jgi:hypothetical protein
LAEQTAGCELTFFYLDAHWYDHLPLLDEMTLILERMSNSVIMVDDFQVPDDPGYCYDDYGEGQVLDLRYLLPLAHYDFAIFFPDVPSYLESAEDGDA